MRLGLGLRLGVRVGLGSALLEPLLPKRAPHLGSD